MGITFNYLQSHPIAGSGRYCKAQLTRDKLKTNVGQEETGQKETGQKETRQKETRQKVLHLGQKVF